MNMDSKTASRTSVVNHDQESYSKGTQFSDRSLLFNTAAANASAESNKDLLNDGEFSAQGF